MASHLAPADPELDLVTANPLVEDLLWRGLPVALAVLRALMTIMQGLVPPMRN